METWFSSDHHFGHRNIITFCNRPWRKLCDGCKDSGPIINCGRCNAIGWEPDVDAMNEALIENWNSVVAPGDQVFYLGDFAMGKIRDTLPIVSRLNGYKILVPGNHDRCHPMHKGHEKWKQKYIGAGFEDILKPLSFYEEFALCHFPSVGDSREGDRFGSWRPHSNFRLLHGHVHDSWVRSGNGINVGCDVWGYKPVNIETLRSHFNNVY